MEWGIWYSFVYHTIPSIPLKKHREVSGRNRFFIPAKLMRMIIRMSFEEMSALGMYLLVMREVLMIWLLMLCSDDT